MNANNHATDELAQRPAGFMRPDMLQARLLARLKTTAEVAAVLRLCHAFKRPVVAQGGLTGLVHGNLHLVIMWRRATPRTP